MGKVTVIAIAGLDLWFNSSDHLPPHFHVTKGGQWEIRVYWLTTTEAALTWDLKWPKKKGTGPSAAMQKELRKAVVANRAALLTEWQEKVVPSEEP